MPQRLVQDETPVEFFKEQLGRAMEHQKVSTSSFVAYYLVNLLTRCVGGELPPPEPGYDETPLALLYVRAAQAARHERARLLRTLGDTALFRSGFFPDAFTRGDGDLDYYRSMGGFAYARLSHDEDPRVFGAEVFGELSDRFVEFSDLLAEVAEASRLHSNASIVKLYERWVQTGSRRAATLLAERGIAPVLPTGGRAQ
jgi:hypothetical protein